MPIFKKTTGFDSSDTTNPTNARGWSTPVSAMLWVLLFASFTLILTACENKTTSEPIINIAPTEVPANEIPATDVPPTEILPTVAPATEEPTAETPSAESPDSPLAVPDSPLAVPEPPLQKSSAFDSPLVIEGTAQAGLGGMGGRVLNTNYDGIQNPYSLVPVRLASVFLEPQTNEKLFILSGAESPGTTTDEEGYFLFDALEPGEYVMMIGDVIGHNQIVTAPDEQAQIFVIETDKVVNAGLIEVELP